jgi:hypothetical protein
MIFSDGNNDPTLRRVVWSRLLLQPDEGQIVGTDLQLISGFDGADGKREEAQMRKLQTLQEYQRLA